MADKERSDVPRSGGTFGTTQQIRDPHTGADVSATQMYPDDRDGETGLGKSGFSDGKDVVRSPRHEARGYSQFDPSAREKMTQRWEKEAREAEEREAKAAGMTDAEKRHARAKGEL